MRRWIENGSDIEEARRKAKVAERARKINENLERWKRKEIVETLFRQGTSIDREDEGDGTEDARRHQIGISSSCSTHPTTTTTTTTTTTRRYN